VVGVGPLPSACALLQPPSGPLVVVVSPEPSEPEDVVVVVELESVEVLLLPELVVLVSPLGPRAIARAGAAAIGRRRRTAALSDVEDGLPPPSELERVRDSCRSELPERPYFAS
jgi:hypothetical protein